MGQKKEWTGKPTLMKELNMGLIRDALAKHPNATRVELSALTKISQPTVNELIRQMRKENVVISLGMAKSTGGRKAEVFALNQKRVLIAAFLVKEACLDYRVMDLELKQEASGRVGYVPERAWSVQLVQAVRTVLEEYPYVGVIMVGVPGAVSAEGEIFAIPQIPEWENYNLKVCLEEAFSLPVIVMNDINAIAVGHSRSYHGGTSNMVYVHIGSRGIGAGIVVEGKLYQGFKSFAGEVGYMQLGNTCGNEEYRKGDLDVRGKHVELIPKIVTNVICVLNPEKIVIGGETMDDGLLEQIRQGCLQYLPQEIMPEFLMMQSGTEYYFKGLGEMGKELLNRHIRLV
ncbi:MAG: ROK family protein [Lachnospiraceae bacterium]|nr:ROK family protein [Lachnospiraceae bacterium]